MIYRILCFVLFIMMGITPLYGADTTFTIEADIPADPSLKEHVGFLDIIPDGQPPESFVIPALDPLGDYHLLYEHVYVDSTNLAPGTYEVHVGLSSVDEAGNQSPMVEHRQPYIVNGETPTDTTPPSIPENVTVQ